MWAMMPMFRVRLRGDWRGIEFLSPTRRSAPLQRRVADAALKCRATGLPAIVRERLVRFRHAMRVLALFHGSASQVGRVEQLVGELLLHGLAVAARAGEPDQPADAERQASVRIHFDRYLIVRAADAPRLHFERRLDVLDRLFEHLQRIVAGLFLNRGQAAVHDSLRGAALAAAHQGADELRHQRAAVQRVEGNFTLWYFSTSRHLRISLRLRPFSAVLRTTLLAS